MPLPLFALAAAAFAIGTTEFVIMGLLPDVAMDLGVSIPMAGLLISGYALGVVVGAPILTLTTGKLPRKVLLISLMGLFIVGNVLAALASSYTLLMAARIVASFTHGSFFGIGSVVAASLVPAERRASAIALMFTGLTLANILGVPLGTLIGQHFGWRATFWAVAGLGLVAAVAVAALVPPVAASEQGSLAAEVAVLKRPAVLVALATTVLGFGGVFLVFTYITPILEQAAGLSPTAVTSALLVFGLGLTLGNVLGGKLADRALMPTLVGVLALLGLVLAVFSVTMHNAVASIATLFVWGMAAFATVPPLQMRVLEKAGDAPNLAASLNIGAFNLGNAGGAFLGGLVIDGGYGYEAVAFAGAAVAGGGLLLALLGWAQDRRAAANVTVAAASC
ncbi:MFS transporter [Nitrospirillum sp. BR 11828]|uniref:MFS transporter n=1 Tax=Nitrospirillum sp. BR 11828 TaxID=3104325 RepID=UPI002ACA06F7|nr:MFS transporter [Nitrospirillum sp. BR 11828]MDZ5648684.1 MFS transporter [Nitrospirillum sp. BR 11828]